MNLTERYFTALAKSWGMDTVEFIEKFLTIEGWPKIKEHFPLFKKWVIKEMKKREIKPHISHGIFYWVIEKDHDGFREQMMVASAEIINDEWLTAAIEGACEILEGEE